VQKKKRKHKAIPSAQDKVRKQKYKYNQICVNPRKLKRRTH